MTPTQSLPVDKIAEMTWELEIRRKFRADEGLREPWYDKQIATLLALLTPDAEGPPVPPMEFMEQAKRGISSAPTSKATAVSRERVQDLVSDWAAALWPNTHVELLKQNALVSLRDAILKLIGQSGEEAGDAHNRAAMIHCPLSALTKAQRKWLLRALPPHSHDGRVMNPNLSIRGHTSYRRMMAELVRHGAVYESASGEHYITDAGRRAAARMIGDRAFEKGTE